MADEDLAIAQTEQAAPAIESPATTEPAVIDEPQMIPEPGEELGEGNEPEAPILDVVEVEWDDGKKYQIPKALEGGLLRNKDYTQKTQSVSERAKALESREAEITHKLAATEDELRDRAKLIGVNERLEQYSKLTSADWSHHASVDPVATENAWREYQLLKDEATTLTKAVETKQSERTAVAERDLATRVQETLVFAQKEIPGFKPELTETLVKFAIGEGVPEAAIKSNWSPTFYKLLHQAHIGKMALSKQATAPKLPTAPVDPLTTVNGKSTPAARTDLASADMEAYVAARKKGVGGKPLR
jgi:hypothetical protein